MSASNLKVLAACLVLALYGAGCCTLANEMTTAKRTGSEKIQKLNKKLKDDPEAALKGFNSYLATHQGFDSTFEEANKRFLAAMEALSKLQYTTVDSDGLQYYYNEHVASVCQAQLGVARAYGRMKDWMAAERWADIANRTAAAKGLEGVLRAEVARDAWMVKYEAFKFAGHAEMEAWAKDHVQISSAGMVEPAMIKQYQQLFAVKADSRKQLEEANTYIGKANSENTSQMINAAAAAGAALGQAANQYANTLNQQSFASGEISRSQYQANQNMNNMNQSNLNHLMQTSLAKSGKFGDIVALGYAFASSGVLDQFTNPETKTDPTEIMKNFVGKAKELGRGDNKFVQVVDTFNDANGVLQGARNAKSPEQIKAAMDGFMPAYEKMQNTMRFRATAKDAKAEAQDAGDDGHDNGVRDRGKGEGRGKGKGKGKGADS